MNEHPLVTLLPALQIAAFERMPEGTFRPLASPPAWFARLGRDGTFPFLGYILEEATAFWSANTDGVREWGPCAEVDETGREFHYRVKALSIGPQRYLVFQLDESAEHMRDILQKVRASALDRTRARSSSDPETED